MKTAGSHAKFTFDTVFAATHDVMSEGARTRQKKNYSVADIEQMQRDAYAEGTQAGETRALEALSAEVAAVSAEVRTILEHSAAEIEAVRSEAASLALALAKKLAGNALAAAPMGEVEAAIRDVMHQAVGEPRLTIRTHPKMTDALKPEMDRIAHEEGFEGRVLLIADSHFGAADCRMEWRGGGAERMQATVESALEDLIARRFSSNTSKE